MPQERKKSVRARPLIVNSLQKFRPEHLFRIYELAKVGTAPSRIADVIGVQRQTMMRWIETRPEVAAAFDEAKSKRLKGTTSFHRYVYERLSPRLKRIWDEIVDLDKEANAQRKVERMLRNKGVRVRQHLWVHALVNSNFNPSEACRMVNVSRSTLEQWVRNDPSFAELVEEIDWHKGNFFEGKLIGLVAAGNTAAILFANRTFNRKRGYGNTIDVNHTGAVANTHVMVDIDSLELPIEVRKRMLDRIRAQRQMDNELALPEHVEDAEVISVKPAKGGVG